MKLSRRDFLKMAVFITGYLAIRQQGKRPLLKAIAKPQPPVHNPDDRYLIAIPFPIAARGRPSPPITRRQFLPFIRSGA